MNERGLPYHLLVKPEVTAEFGGQGNKKAPREKIKGTQDRQKREKSQPKKWIRNPFIRKK